MLRGEKLTRPSVTFFDFDGQDLRHHIMLRQQPGFETVGTCRALEEIPVGNKPTPSVFFPGANSRHRSALAAPALARPDQSGHTDVVQPTKGAKPGRIGRVPYRSYRPIVYDAGCAEQVPKPCLLIETGLPILATSV